MFDTEIGRLGGLICGEHEVPAHLMIMAGQNDRYTRVSGQRHFHKEGSIVLRDNLITVMKAYCRMTCSFGLVAVQLQTQEMIEFAGDYYEPTGEIGCGCACVISPAGNIISEFLSPEAEGIVCADIDLNDIYVRKNSMNLMGQMSNPAYTLVVNRNSRIPLSLSARKPIIQ